MNIQTTKLQLQVIQDDDIIHSLPTGKSHVSYSEIHDWLDCSWRHNLKYVLKIPSGDGSTVHTEYGQVVHDAMEDYFMKLKENGGVRYQIDAAPYIKDFKKRCKTLLDEAPDMELDEKTKLVDNMKEFCEAMPKTLLNAPVWLDKTFPGWEPVSAEEELMEPIPGQESVKFKGFVDAFIRYPKRRKKRQSKADKLRLSELDESQETAWEYFPDQWEYMVLDYKTTGWGWQADKKRDPVILLQVMLYKYFFCQKKNLEPEQIKCGFVLLKRKPDKEGNYCELIPVSTGTKSIDKTVSTLHQMINQVKQGRALKNKFSCKFCKYLHTEHCP